MKKGFTLIELLAVIVILAIIALIATPIILNVIEDLQVSSAKLSAENYLRTVGLTMVNNEVDSDDTNDITDGTYTVSELKNTYSVSVNGTEPTSGIVTILNGKIISSELVVNGYELISDDNQQVTNDVKVYGLRWDGNSTYTRLEDAKNMVASISGTNDFDNAQIYKEMKEVVVDGNQFIKIPKFYIKKVVNNGTWEWYISKTKQDSSYYLPACFYDETTNSEMPYVLVGKYNGSLSSDNKLESKTGTIVLVNKNINQFRTYARANNTLTSSGYQLLDIHVVDVLQTLFYIEYGTLNSQSIMNGYVNGQSSWSDAIKVVSKTQNTITITENSGSLFKVGQLIDIATIINGRDKASNLKITAISGDTLTLQTTSATTGSIASVVANNIVYNVSNMNGSTDSIATLSGEIDNSGEYSMKYRGIENLYGALWQFVDGVNVSNTANKIFVARNATDYASDVVDEIKYVSLNYGKLQESGYVSEMGYDSSNPFAQLPVATTEDNASEYSDHTAVSTTSGICTLYWGGSPTAGSRSGINAYYMSLVPSTIIINLGSRLVKTPY